MATKQQEPSKRIHKKLTKLGNKLKASEIQMSEATVKLVTCKLLLRLEQT